jgi:hypothetical protein
LFSACKALVAPNPGEGTVILILPGGSPPRDRAVVSGPVLNDMYYYINCTGPDSTKDLTMEGGGAVSIGLSAGSWHITVEAKYQNTMTAGHGAGDVEVRAGASNTVDIKMTPTDEFIFPIIIRQPQTAAVPWYYAVPALEVEAMTFAQASLSYQWYRNTTAGNTGGTPIPGATGSSYTPPGGTVGTVYYYYVVVTGADNRVKASNPAGITIIAPDTLSITSTKTAEGGAYGIGEPLKYQVTAYFGGNPYNITSMVSNGDFSYNFSTAGTKTVTIAPGSPLAGIPLSPACTVSVKTIEERVAWANGQGGDHTLLLYANEGSITGVASPNIDNAAITLKSSDVTTGGMRTLSLGASPAYNGSMFYIADPSNVDAGLILDQNVTLIGKNANDAPVVYVEDHGELIMEAGSVITGNTNTGSYGGGGVATDGDGIFTMNGGDIYNNEAAYGGGVYSSANTPWGFTMRGQASIRHNRTTGYGYGYGGGGVYFNGSGTFTMEMNASIENNVSMDGGGGIYIASGNFTIQNFSGDSVSIFRNESIDSGGGVFFNSTGTFAIVNSVISTGSASISENRTWPGSYGGGVYLYDGTFDMSSGTITDNEAEMGGGVYVYTYGNFAMGGSASISDNTATTTAGGVYFSGTTFTMEDDASISNNEATGTGSYGGGVYLGSGTFDMSGGTITDNRAEMGGGVLATSSMTFTMSGSASVSNNEAIELAGGVHIDGTTFTMEDTASISGNTVTSPPSGEGGGGVYMYSGNFSMVDSASISGNTATNSSNAVGGGVFMYSGNFSMDDNASISGNTADRGGGVDTMLGTTFIMSGSASIYDNDATNAGGGIRFGGSTFVMEDSASIYDNRAPNGGGVQIASGTFTMEDSTSIHDNDATQSGGGVFFSGTTFNMNGGTISGNGATEATARGGGVYISSGTFNLNLGTVYGTDAVPAELQNTAPAGRGAAISRMNIATYNGPGTFTFIAPHHYTDDTVVAP